LARNETAAMERRCQTCAWWVEESTRKGECHRYPARYLDYPKWPVTSYADWCGEWKSKTVIMCQVEEDDSDD